VARQWRTWLDRRGNDVRFTWGKFNALMEWLPLPRPRVVHSARVAKP
jgi:hypothetical protein